MQRRSTEKNPLMDVMGQRYGRLTVARFSRDVKKQGKSCWECLCDCGNKILALRFELTNGKITSCGCNRYKRLPEGEASFNQLLRDYKRNARTRGLSFELSSAEFREIVKRNCFYCDKSPDKFCGAKANNGKFNYIGIDRVDNSRGYLLNNCVPCCESCNHRKGGVSIDMINKIHNFISSPPST